MAVYLVILLCSLWLLYNSFADIFMLPIIMVYPDAHFVLRLLSSLALKWAMGFGVLGVGIAVAGFILGRKFDEKVSQMVFLLMGFYLLISAFLLI